MGSRIPGTLSCCIESRPRCLPICLWFRLAVPLIFYGSDNISGSVLFSLSMGIQLFPSNNDSIVCRVRRHKKGKLPIVYGLHQHWSFTCVNVLFTPLNLFLWLSTRILHNSMSVLQVSALNVTKVKMNVELIAPRRKLDFSPVLDKR